MDEIIKALLRMDANLAATTCLLNATIGTLRGKRLLSQDDAISIVENARLGISAHTHFDPEQLKTAGEALDYLLAQIDLSDPDGS